MPTLYCYICATLSFTKSPSKEQELHAQSPFLFQDSGSGIYAHIPPVSLESEVSKICF